MNVIPCDEITMRRKRKKKVRGAQSRYFELFLPRAKLRLVRRKPENSSLLRQKNI